MLLLVADGCSRCCWAQMMTAAERAACAPGILRQSLLMDLRCHACHAC